MACQRCCSVCYGVDGCAESSLGCMQQSVPEKGHGLPTCLSACVCIALTHVHRCALDNSTPPVQVLLSSFYLKHLAFSDGELDAILAHEVAHGQAHHMVRMVPCV